MWGTPIGRHQGLAHPLAKAKIEVELARLMTQKAAWTYDAGLDAGEAANFAKYAAAEAALGALDQAIQTHGGNGMSSEFGLADMWGTGTAHAHGPGQPGDDPQLRGPALAAAAQVVLIPEEY